ncbi:hypothetical protein [Enterococcus faecium]|uniref:hypothetical protein n=1 Tax=Enterococcus faecium TaxID=1352 RepID=UPI0021B0A44F|nr:hypothetical protein [Enterococcus faecium]
MDKVKSELSEYAKKNQENVEKFRQKLARLQEESRLDAMTISSLNSQISALLSAAMSLET